VVADCGTVESNAASLTVNQYAPADVDHDGTTELLIADHNSNDGRYFLVYCWNGTSGTFDLEAEVGRAGNGVIRAIGLGCRQHEFHQRCIASGEFDVSLTFHDYNLAVQTADQGVIQPATKQGVGVFNATVTLNGMLTDDDPMARWSEWDQRWEDRIARVSPERAERIRKHRAQAKEQAESAAKVWQWCQARDLSLLALNLQFCLRDPRIASTLIGFTRPARVDEDIAACWVPIPESVWDELYETFDLRQPE